MNALLDTHAFLWWVTDDARLSQRAAELLGDGENRIYLSVATVWEIAIKAGLGKLRLPTDPQRFIERQLVQNAIEVLPIALAHALQVYTLPALHRDPFDRILVAQSQAESLPIVTADLTIGGYGVQTLW